MKRRRRKLPRKYRNRRILLVVVIIGLLALAAFLFSSLTATDAIAVEGTQKVSNTAVRQIAENYTHKSYLALDKKSLKNRLESLPYVKHAEIGLGFPHTLKISIQEEQPVAQIYTGDGYLLVSDAFKALEKTRSYRTSLPKLTGIPTEEAKLGQVVFEDAGNEKKIAMIRRLLHSEMRDDLNTIAVLDQGMKLSFADGTTVYIRSYNDSEYKVKQLEEIRKEMKLKGETYREIYLDQGENPIAVKPSSMDDVEEETGQDAVEGDVRSSQEKSEEAASSKDREPGRSEEGEGEEDEGASS